MRVHESAEVQRHDSESVCEHPVLSEGELSLRQVLLNAIVFLALSVYVLVLHGGEVEVGDVLIACIWLYPLFHVLVLLHEIGHALMARLLGMRLDRITVGTGRSFLTFRLIGTPVVLRQIPFGGAAHAYLADAQQMRLKQALMTAGGPLMDAVVLIAAVAMYPTLDWFYNADTGFSVQLALLMGIVMVVSGSTLIRGLWPHEVWMDGRKVPNDGLWLRRLLFPRGNDVAELQLTQGYALGHGQRFADARTVYLGILQVAGLDAEMRTKVLDSLACLPIYYDCPEYLAEADEWSRQALELFPSSQTLRGTRGSLLVLMDKVSEGKAMLQEVFVQSPTQLDRSISACFLALVAARESDFKRAAELLDLTKRIDPACVVLDKITKEIDRLQGQVSHSRPAVQA